MRPMTGSDLPLLTALRVFSRRLAPPARRSDERWQPGVGAEPLRKVRSRLVLPGQRTSAETLTTPFQLVPFSERKGNAPGFPVWAEKTIEANPGNSATNREKFVGLDFIYVRTRLPRSVGQNWRVENWTLGLQPRRSVRAVGAGLMLLRRCRRILRLKRSVDCNPR